MLRYASLGSSLFLLWLLLSGYFEPLLLSFGIGSCALVAYIAWRMDGVDRAGFAILLSVRLIPYVIWLVGEIFRANVRVARIILTPRLPISPIVVPFRAHQKTDLCKVIYANSITLTPGTITTGVEGDMLRIHALTWKDIDGREEDKMDQMICSLEPPEDQR